MAIYEITASNLVQLSATTFAAAGVRERADLQRLLRDHIDVLAADLMVIAEEFTDWEDSKRRIDLLCIDADAQLVVVELKRTEDGGHVELQALRYAAMVSTMTFEKAVDAFTKYLDDRGRREEARTELLTFLGWDEPNEAEFNQKVRILLASAEFSKEVTTTVLWLNQQGLDIRCVRLVPYVDGSRLFVDVQPVIPLPEAEDYQVKLRTKESEEKRAASRRWDSNALLGEVGRSAGPDAVAIAEKLLAWADEQDLDVRWGTGNTRGRFTVSWDGDGECSHSYPLFVARTDGKVVIWIDKLRRKPALLRGDALSTFASGLQALLGDAVHISGADRQTLAMRCLLEGDRYDRFVELLGQLVQAVRRWHEEHGF